ncbi:LLM class flavin-dependent oxidoreductase [Paenirhodobacter populi]|nr:LLM class flavin-dependent oxidoreductase [Sinirhodobacter populi]
MRLGAFLQDVGHHIAAWRHPDVPATGGISFGHYARLAQIAERGKFDAVFFGDMSTIMYPEDEALGQTARAVHIEPQSLLPALAMVTGRIGLISTASTTYNEPYALARRFAAIDHISGGRAGWNIVTSWTHGEALNASLAALPTHDERYVRAEEFVDVIRDLWDSFDDDAILADKDSGQFFDPARLHVLNHKGQHFQVRGPLNVTRPPQGWPVLVQAGSSDDGQALAARVAEVIFTAQTGIEDSLAFRTKIRARAAGFGRDPDGIKVMPGVMPVVGRSRAEAEDKFHRFQELIRPEIGWAIMRRHLGGHDLSGLLPDAPVPQDLPLGEGNQSRIRLLMTVAAREGWTVRDLYWYVVGSRGHWLLLGTAEEIADQLEARFTAGAADGFNIMPPWLPGGLEEFVDQVVPILQRRGLFRTDYSGTTLRDHLGLARPRGRYSDADTSIQQVSR